VVYDGTHTGDWIPSQLAAGLLNEVDTVLHSRDILTDAEREFFEQVQKLCRASIETQNPIVF
jgi:hypothetical protein